MGLEMGSDEMLEYEAAEGQNLLSGEKTPESMADITNKKLEKSWSLRHYLVLK